MCASSKLEEWESCQEVSGRWLKASDAKFSFWSRSLGRCSSGPGPLLLSVKLMTLISAATTTTNTIIPFWSVPTAAPGASIMGNLSVLLLLLSQCYYRCQNHHHCSIIITAATTGDGVRHWKQEESLHFSPSSTCVLFSPFRKWHRNNMPISLTVQMQNSPENISNLSQSVC